MKLPAHYPSLKWWERKTVREKYIEQQNGRCCYCDKLLVTHPDVEKPINKKLFPRSFFDHPVHLHHDHKTGMTIGAIHAVCNAISWQYEGV